MATQEREIVDLLWDGGQADALDKLKDMLQVKAAAANGETPPKMNGREDPRKTAARSSASQNGNGNK